MAASPPAHTLRLRAPTAALLGLPWELPLKAWSAEGVRFVDLPIGPSRHLVRFAVVDGAVLALKELPGHPARREYEALRQLEERDVPAVRAVGLAERTADGAAILVTRYLARSFQFRRLFMRLPEGTWRHRERLLDALANLLVELHLKGVFWGDGSLANTLLVRDGQVLQAHLVDAETTEVHAQLSDGQRAFDLEVAVENVAGDLADLAGLAGRGLDQLGEELAAADSIAERYERLWEELHREEPVRRDERFRVEARLRRLNELGFVIDEVQLTPSPADGDRLQLRVGVGGRRFHALRLRQLTGLDVQEGQATILLNDLAARQSAWACDDPDFDASAAAERWRSEVFEPTVQRLRRELGFAIDPVQAYCDLLEVRWLLSERAGRDVGDDVALAALRGRAAPADSAAGMALVEAPTGLFSVRELLASEPDPATGPKGARD
ncbi:MAG: DUF4032 domain-containing protein [Candidatus Limnocylindrales bacterium]